MINKALEFLRNELNKSIPRGSSDEALEDLFVYVDTPNDGSLKFSLNAVSIAMVGLEEERNLRQGDPYVRRTAIGINEYENVIPDIKLYLWALFVARFPNDYAQALRRISEVIAYFQGHRVFNRQNSPNMDVGMPKLIVELFSPSFDEQHKIWSMLSSPYQPSALYKITLCAFQSQEAQPVTTVQSINREIENIDKLVEKQADEIPTN